MREVWIKNDAANPTHSFKDRVVAVAIAKAQELGFETVACASTGNLANAVAAQQRPPAWNPTSSFPPTSKSRSCSRPASTGRSSRHQRQLRRRQPALHAALPRRGLGVRERQPAPLLRRGLEDGRLRDVEQLGWELPDRIVCPVASGSLFTKIAAGSRVARAGPRRGGAAPFNGAQAEDATRSRRVRERWDVCKPQRPDTIAKSLAIGNPADGLRARARARDRRRDQRGLRRRDPRGSAARRDDWVFTETAGGVTTAVLAKLAQGGEIGGDERVVR